MKAILITGAAGFLGFHLARALQTQDGTHIYCVDNFSRGVHDDAYDELIRCDNVTGLVLDLCDPASIKDLPKSVDVVYHLAALNGTQNFYERPFEVMRSTTLPAFWLLEKYRDCELQRFVYAGSSESYASTVTRFGWEVPTSENVPLCVDDIFNPRWSYGVSKIHGELLTINACRHFSIPFAIARYHNIFGPRMGDRHIIPDFLSRAREGIFELFGFEETRTFMFVDDAVRASILLGEDPRAIGRVINVGGAEEISMLDLAIRILHLAGLESHKLELHPAPAGSVFRRAPNTDALQSLGFHPRWTLNDGLLQMIREYLPAQ